MTKLRVIIIGVAVIVAGIFGFIFSKEAIVNEPPVNDKIRVSSPLPGTIVESPLSVRGEARGFWYFEASFPVRLLDANGTVLIAVPAQAKSDPDAVDGAGWMTMDFVPFEAVLEFPPSSTKTGTLVLVKDNPSGLAENDDSISIPVQFASVVEQKKTKIKLYYYNSELDKDTEGNVQCSRLGLTPVEREVAISQTPIQDAIRLLLGGEIEPAERARGISTEYPLAGFRLVGASLVDGVLTLTFDDPKSVSSGGSCRAGILWFQIEATAKQFSSVKEVRFMPEDIFQP